MADGRNTFPRLPLYEYVIARNCGHRTRVEKVPHSRIEYCESCNRYVGVIVTAKARDPK